ncbi:hypothetical protein BDP27DRAFT_1366149 [Rhodocollybia butyracea]|uniref:Uncharacterized protein n=1 Tax=Rhodocollybia butyracea TaxID=206335 RepID=A0A9P5PNK4_9AGAR|nr:hypothetical protein BDP27DRAFT_1366149 [Rhodocollybia butyracea]
MSPIHAYYLPADSTSAIDASHPVSVEQLSTLGWKLSSVGGGPDEIELAGRKVAQELGFPVTQEGCIVPFNFDLEINAATLAPEMAAILMKVAELENSDICLTNEAAVAITSGNLCIDVEDVTTAGWVRIHSGAGTLYRLPIGAKYRVAFDEKNRATAGVVFYKETISNVGWLVNKEIDNHPARQAYLAQVLGQT